MVTVTVMSKVDYSIYDEVWAIVRSLKYANQKIKHVPELSPSWSLFKKYLAMRNAGEWNNETFQAVYVPWFLNEMRGKVQQKLMNDLFNTKKHICLVCFCTEEELCHRSIIGGMLQGAGLDVRGLEKDYSYYFDWYKKGVPGVPCSDKKPLTVKKVTEYNSNVGYMYESDAEDIFDKMLPTLMFTGRRPKDLCWYDTVKYKGFVDDLMKLVYEEFYCRRGIRRFLSGGAQGFDQMAFWAVEKMKKVYGCTDIENVVFMPFEGQELRWAEKGLFSQAEYWLMVKNADKVVVTCEDNSIESLFTRNHAMCAQSGTCLGMYPDNSWHTAKGGTAECLRHAEKNGLDVFRLGYEIDGFGLHMNSFGKA